MYEMKLGYFTKNADLPFFIQYSGHRGEIFPHTHADFSELVIVLRGSAEHVVGEERFAVSGGDAFVVGRGQSHGFENVNELRVCNIMFREEEVFGAEYDVKELEGFRALFTADGRAGADGFMSRLKLPPSEFSEAERIVEKAVREFSGNEAGSRTMLTGLFLQLAVLLSRGFAVPVKYCEIAGIAEAAAYMEQHYADDISIEEILRASHYSQRHFMRLFLQAYHTTPQRYLTDIRMLHARRLLRESPMNVTEIALSCGYKDSNYFCRAFKKYTGTTPSGYRSGS